MFTLLTIFGIFFAGIASAALELKTVTVPTTVSHNQGAIPIVFSLNNTGALQTGLEWTGTPNIGSWNLASLPTTINAGAQIQFTVILTIPKNSAGTIQANLNVESNEGESDSLNQPLSIIITREATLSITKTQELTSERDGIISVANTGNVQLSNIELSSSGDFTVSFSQNNINLLPGNSLNVNVIRGNITDLKFGANSVTIIAKDLNENVSSNSVSFSIGSGFCKSGEKGELNINDVNIESDGEDEDVWKPLDTITIDVEIENDGDEEIQDVIVKLGLFDSNGNDFADDLDFENEDEEKIDLGDLDDGDEETVTFKFTIPADFDEKGDFKLAIKAYSDDEGENQQCTDRSSDLSDNLFEDIEIEREDDEGKLIAFDNIKAEPSEVLCGDSVKITTDVFNLGDDEQDQVKVNLINNKLGIDLSREIKEDLSEGDKKEVNFEFIIPKTSTDGSYTFDLSAEYDYRRGTYRESSDDTTPVILKVFGCGAITDGRDKQVSIAASLESEAKAGQELVVKTVITNLGADQRDFAVTASGYENWAKLDSISDRLINLKSGESKEVIVRLNVNSDAEGEKSFIMEARSGDKLETREIAVNIESGQRPGLGGLNLGGNSLVWIIGIINVILIILIIVVAARISKR